MKGDAAAIKGRWPGVRQGRTWPWADLLVEETHGKERIPDGDGQPIERRGAAASVEGEIRVKIRLGFLV